MKTILWTYGGTSRLKDRTLRESLRSVDELAALPDLTLEEHGVVGAKGSLSVVDRGFIFHAYFVGSSINFELYGPMVPGAEQSRQPAEGLLGSMDVACLKETLRLLDGGLDPREHVRSNAPESRPADDA